jgi:hypothetical protein
VAGRGYKNETYRIAFLWLRNRYYDMFSRNGFIVDSMKRMTLPRQFFLEYIFVHEPSALSVWVFVRPTMCFDPGMSQSFLPGILLVYRIKGSTGGGNTLEQVAIAFQDPHPSRSLSCLKLNVIQNCISDRRQTVIFEALIAYTLCLGYLLYTTLKSGVNPRNFNFDA